MSQRLAPICLGAALAVPFAGRLAAAPGDIVSRMPLPIICTGAPLGLGFDGTTLYYTLRVPVSEGTVHMVDARTGEDRGSFVLRDRGNPVGSGGIAWDLNRGKLWVGSGGWIYLVSVPSGDVERRVSYPHFCYAAAHDPWSDLLWVSAADRDTTYRKQAGNGQHEGGIFDNDYADNGLAFDGTDLWRLTPTQLRPPGPPVRRTFFPYDNDTATIDYDRLIQLPNSHNDMAFDCRTFPVPVMWVANNEGCDLVAFEVDSTSCLAPDADKLLVARVEFQTSRTARLPLEVATAEYAWRMTSPVRHTLADWVPDGGLFPLIYFKLAGPRDATAPNRLRLHKSGLDVEVSE